MDTEALFKQIQSWTNNIPLVILGSGASVPFGLPSMWKLGEYLKANISFVSPDDQTQFESFKDFFDKTGDLEAALSEFHLRPNVLDEIVCKTWELVNQHDLDAYDQLTDNSKDFPLAELITHLLSSAGKKLSIITTNYDRLAEYAASFANSFICTGYSQNYFGHFSNTIHTNNLATLKGFKGHVNIWKVHGSLDWFKTSEEQNIQFPLRHTIPAVHKPSIVTPGLSKYYETHNEPYRTIFAQADSEIDNATGYLCIGYGFNDSHVQPKLINQIKNNNKPIIVITKELTPKTKQSIIDNKCRNYILIEEYNKNDTRVYSSNLGDYTLSGVSYWSLAEYFKLLTS
jgi:hypothetical protein